MPLTEIQLKYGPFAEAVQHWPGRDHVVTCDAESRLDLIKSATDLDWLQAVIRDRDVQASVRLAVGRLRVGQG